MKPPPQVLAAIAQVSYRVVCVEDCLATVPVEYNATRDAIVIRHSDPACECVTDPHGKAAVALAEYVNERLSEYVAMAQYGEELPLNVGGDAP